MPIFIDIEVSQADPLPWTVPDVATMEPPGTMKKPDTIAAWRAEKSATIIDDLRKESSLHTILGGFIVCAGIAVNDKPISVLVAPSLDETGEVAMLRKLQSGLERYPDEPLVAYNGAAYDFVWLRHRALRHGLYSLARRAHQAKPWSVKCLDAYLLWSGAGRGVRGKLHEVARFLGIESDDTTTGKDVQALLDAGNLDAVKAHCAEDVRLLREIFACFAAAGWVEGEDPDNYAPREPMPPRLTVRQQIAEEMVGLSPALIQDAATAAGIPWQTGTEVGEARPVLEGATREALQGFLRALLDRRVAA